MGSRVYAEKPGLAASIGAALLWVLGINPRTTAKQNPLKSVPVSQSAGVSHELLRCLMLSDIVARMLRTHLTVALGVYSQGDSKAKPTANA